MPTRRSKRCARSRAPDFARYVAELKGDILLGQNKPDEAREAYRAAQAAAAAADPSEPSTRSRHEDRRLWRNPMRLHRNLCALVGVALLSAGCSWFSWLPWVDKKVDPDAPAELTQLQGRSEDRPPLGWVDR